MLIIKMKIDNFNWGKNGMKYEVVKTILVWKLLEKYKEDKHWIQIFPELEFEEDEYCSIYFVDLKRKIDVIYQITKNELKDSKYEKFVKDGGTVIAINYKQFPNDINEIEKEIEEII